MKYSVNWIKTKAGNGAKEGSAITIKVLDADFIVYGVYKDGFPVIVGQTHKGDNEDTFLLKRKGMSLKGNLVLKTSAYSTKGIRSGWTDVFVCI